jgi:hypothetical protein
MASVQQSGGNPVALLNPGERGPSYDVVHDDFPDLDLPDGLGHDGQQFYAIARDPLHPDAVAPQLDRPRYRLQRIAYPLASWALHPSGGGLGLVYSMFAVGIVSLFVGGLAVGSLAVTNGLPSWCAVIGAALPGSAVAVRFSTADSLAVAAALGAIALAERRKLLPAIAAAIVAVLAKEAILVTLAAYVLARRDRRTIALVAIPLAFAGAWWLFLRAAVEATGAQVIEFTLPFQGLARAVRFWSDGGDWWAALVVAVTAVLTVIALLRLSRRSFWWPLVAVNAAFVTVLSKDAVGVWANSARVVAPTMLFATLGIISTLITAPKRAAGVT